jgi:hypothetical protein
MIPPRIAELRTVLISQDVLSESVAAVLEVKADLSFVRCDL